MATRFSAGTSMGPRTPSPAINRSTAPGYINSSQIVAGNKFQGIGGRNTTNPYSEVKLQRPSTPIKGLKSSRLLDQETTPSPIVYKSHIGDRARPGKSDVKRTGHFGRDLFFEVLEHSAVKETYEEVIERLKLIGEKYYDAEFPPEWSSLIGYASNTETIDLSLWKTITWKRANEIYKDKGLKVFSDNVNPKDIIQGYLGDCYFLSSLAAIAEKPARIKRILGESKQSTSGVYSVKLCIMGLWKEVILDDYFPYYEPEQNPAFTRASSGDLWPMLLEKAWAKTHRGYLNINSGSATECLHDLTGAPTSTFRVDSPKLWDQILNGEKNSFIMTAGSSSQAGQDILSSIGLVGSHAYSLLGAVEVFVEGFAKSRLAQNTDDRKSKGFRRLVKIRNPWGRGEWKGDWSNNSHLWSSDLKKKLDVRSKEDGIFYMDLSDFKKYFSDVHVCYFHDSFKFVSQPFDRESEDTYIRIKVQKEGIYYVSTHQTPSRHFPSDSQYEYSLITLVLARVTPSGTYEYIQGVQSAERESFVCCQCSKPGEYIAYIRTAWKTNIKTFTVSVYGPDEASMQAISEQQYGNVSILNHIYLDRAQKFPGDFKTFEDQGEPNIRYFHEHLDEGFGYFYFENASDETGLLASIILKQAKNIELIEPFEGLQADVDVPAGASDIILYRQIGRPSSLSYVISQTFKRSQFALKSIALEKGKKSARPTQEGEEVGIFVYSYRTQDGFISLYQNKSQNYRLEEQGEYIMENCQILGASDGVIKMNIGPGEEKYVYVKKNPDALYFKINISNLKYRVKPV